MTTGAREQAFRRPYLESGHGSVLVRRAPRPCAEAGRDALHAAADRADEGTQPPADLHGTADCRRHLARVLTGGALAAAAGL